MKIRQTASLDAFDLAMTHARGPRRGPHEPIVAVYGINKGAKESSASGQRMSFQCLLLDIVCWNTLASWVT